MRRLKAILAALLLTATTAWADDYKYLTVTTTDGEHSYEVASITRITFDAENMLVWNGDVQLGTLPLASLSKMAFTVTPTGIMAIEPASKTTLRGGMLHVQAKAGSRITLYNIRGVVVKEVVAAAEDTELSLTGLQKGVYIVKVGSQATKVMNK